MKKKKTSNVGIKTPTVINVQTIEAIGNKFALINSYIEAGNEIPTELTKNFITCPLVEDPYSSLE